MKNVHEPGRWEGYTLEELYIRRAEIYARKEIEKYRLNLALNHIKDSTPMIGGVSSFFGKSGSWLKYLEYGLIAYKLARRFIPFFKHKR